jgi:uncharacterized membrane protein
MRIQAGAPNRTMSIMQPRKPTMRLTCFGRTVFAVALAALGVLSLVSGDFAYIWQPVPPWVPGRPALAYASGALLLACGAGLLWPRTRARTSLVLGLYGLASMLLLHVPLIAVRPLDDLQWFGLSEIAILVAGAWILFGCADPAPASGWRKAVGGERGARLARWLFALALLPIGLSHFLYADVTAKMVPSWLPGHFGWAYLTGAGHIAAALGILLGVLPRLGALLEALMVGTFVLTVHVPEVLATPRDRYPWTELFVACFIGSAALLVVRTYRGTPWLGYPGPFSSYRGRASSMESHAAREPT